MAAWKRIGIVRSANAMKRELRVDCEDRYRSWLEGAKSIHIESGGAPVPCRIQSVRLLPGEAIVQLTPGVPKDLIGGMRRSAVLARAEDVAGIDATPSRASDLIGYRVVDVDGQDLGEITNAYETAYNAAIQVESEGRSFMLPFIDAVLEAIDPEEALVVVRDVAQYAVEEGVDDAD